MEVDKKLKTDHFARANDAKPKKQKKNNKKQRRRSEWTTFCTGHFQAPRS
jgi:hypothetical protein